MIVSFNEPIPDGELDQYLRDIEQVMRDTGLVQTFSSARHIRVPADDHSPVGIATAVIQIGYADHDALVESFDAPGAGELIQRWQSRYPYKAIWVNHEPLS